MKASTRRRRAEAPPRRAAAEEPRSVAGRDDFAAAARAWWGMATMHRRAGRAEAADACIHEAITAARQSSESRLLLALLDELARSRAQQHGRLPDARALAEHALTVAQQLDPLAREGWQRYGVLADLAEREAATEADGPRRAALLAQAQDHREVERQAPRIVAALGRLDHEAVEARALVLERLGRCFDLGGRPDLALDRFREALRLAHGRPGEPMHRLRIALSLQAADALKRLGCHAEAETARRHGLALQEAERLRAAASACDASGLSTEDAAYAVTVFDEETTDCVFEPDLLLDGAPLQRVHAPAAGARPPADDSRPVLGLGTRTVVDDDGAVRFCLPDGEPAIERRHGYVAMHRRRREVVVRGGTALLWCLLRGLDGRQTTAAVLASVDPRQRPLAARLLAALLEAGVLDGSGRAMGRWVHAATKKGVLSGGGLDGDAVLRLATDGHYRRYADTPPIALSAAVPERLQAFHALTRARRSRRDFDARPLARADLEALLQTACGVTGTLRWNDRDVKLRAYPSSGALYAVEIYPVMLRVDGVQPAIGHYRAVEHALDIVKAPADRDRIVAAMLPVEREMVAAVPLVIALVGHFARHERKYGQGGYRMMVAEAGHVSQNLVLAATALGLSARPFGGVFDDLLNDVLGLERETEQFLLAVLVGHAGNAA